MNEQQHETVCIRLLHVWNSTTVRPLTLVLEPWGEVYTEAPESGVDVIAHGPEGGRLEVSIRDDGVSVYGWTRSVAHVEHDGVVIEPFAPATVNGAGHS